MTKEQITRHRRRGFTDFGQTCNRQLFCSDELCRSEHAIAVTRCTRHDGGDWRIGKCHDRFSKGSFRRSILCFLWGATISSPRETTSWRWKAAARIGSGCSSDSWSAHCGRNRNENAVSRYDSDFDHEKVRLSKRWPWMTAFTALQQKTNFRTALQRSLIGDLRLLDDVACKRAGAVPGPLPSAYIRL